MLDIKKIIEKPDFYIKKFSDKNYDLKKEVYKLVEIYNEYISFLKEEQEKRTELNKVTENIKKNSSVELKEAAQSISKKAKELTSKISLLKNEIETIMLNFPNIALPEIKIGNSEADNKIISTHLDELKNLNKFSVPHWVFLENNMNKYVVSASKISGPRHFIYKNNFSLFINALERYMLERHVKSNFDLIETPLIVNREALVNTGQLPKFEEDLYKLDNDQFLIPTAEVPLLNLNASKILDLQELPIKLTAFSNCFRSEAGSAGKDTRGLIRLHQFRKIEIVSLDLPENVEKAFNNVLDIAKNILIELKIPFRVVELCTGDMPFTSEKTYDIEVWMPGVQEYREISSVSSTCDFQTRRMKTRVKLENNDKVFPFAFNGSALAIERTVAAIIENNIDEDGKVKIPEVLLKYLDFKYL